MKKFYNLLFIVFFQLLFSQNSFHDTKGNIEVNAGGQLQFSLPIELPKGIKNVSPNISLIYTSNAGNGIAGYGWSLSGVTTISRVGKTIEKDGELKGVKLDTSDYFSYNGQKLILKSGTYGGDGAEYVTEKYSNIKIKSLGTGFLSGLSGPSTFEVTFEDGSQAIYGGFTNTDLLVANSRTPIEYNITKWKDAQGNYITYNYTQSNKVAVISSIQWGGNENLSTPHFNEIVFNYFARDFKEQSYVNGTQFIQDKLLNNVIVKTNGTQFKKYVIEYFKNGTNYQFANKITEYNANNEPANPVIFEYPTLTPSTVVGATQSNPDPFDGVKLTGDFNGDSYLDFVMSNGTIKLGAFNDNFTTVTTNKYFNSDALVVSTLLDEEGQVYNGNGIVQYESGKLVGYIFRSNTFVKVFEKLVYDQSDCTYQGGGAGCHITTKLNEADIDGDGIANILLTIDREDCEWIVDPIDPMLKKSSKSDTTSTKNTTDQSIISRPPPGGTLYCRDIHIGDFIVDLKNASLPVANYTIDSGINYTNTSNEKFLDVDGDGKAESINVSNTAYTVFEFVKTGVNQYLKKIKYTANLVETKDPEFPVLFGDFNGDGKLDFTIPITQGKVGKDDWRFYIGTGTGFNTFRKNDFLVYKNISTIDNGIWLNYSRTFYSIADLNKDGKSDIVQVYSYSNLLTNNSRTYGVTVNTVESKGINLSDNSIDFDLKNIYTFPSSGFTISPDVYDFSIYQPLTNPIKANNNYYDVFLYRKSDVFKIKAPTSLAELSRIKSINQAGLTTSITYLELNPNTNPNFYKKVKKEYYPYFSLQRVDQTYAVSQIQQGLRKQDFRYRGMTAHLQGRGMLGFLQSARSSWYADGFENTKIWSGAEIDPQNYGTPIKEWSIKTNDENQIFPSDISVNNTQLANVKITSYTTQQLANGVLVILPQSVTEKDFFKNITSVSTITYGNYYLPSFTEINVNNSFARKTSEMRYVHNATGTGNSYYIGRPDWKEDIVYAYNDTKKAKEVYTYNNNLLQSVTKYDNTNVGWIKEQYTYDEGLQGIGNITKKITTNSVDSQIITVQDKYDASGRFVIKKTDNLGLETNYTYNSWGQVLTQTDTFGNTVTNSYDYWGKLLTSTTNLGGATTYTYEKFEVSSFRPIPLRGTKITENLPNGNSNIVFTNQLGQKYKTISKSFSQNTYVAKEVKYDAIGRQIAESEPYITPYGVNAEESNIDSSTWNSVAYDDSVFPPKVTAQAFNNGKKIETTVSGNTITVKEINGYGRITSKTTDALGNVSSSTDAGGTITFTYNAIGQNLTATYEGNVVKTSYDVWGRKSEFNDPANGIYKYEYTGFGDIKKETSPKGNKQYTYKSNGLLETITEISDDGTSTDKNITLSYNTKWQVISKSGTSLGKTYQHTYDYYTDGRLKNDIENSNNIQFYNSNFTYDSFGRIKRYDKGLVSGGVTTSVAIENVYNTWDGSLYQLKQEGTGKILSEIQSVNAKGQILQAKLGASQITNTYDSFGFLTNEKHIAGTNNLMDVSYSFNAIKNELNERHHYNFNIDEYFTYDNNNRLTNWTNPRTGQLSNNTYDNKGRITFNDQLGNITFNLGGNLYRATNLTLNTQGLANFDYNGQSKLVQNITYNENNDPIDIDGTLSDYHFEYGLTDSRQFMSYNMIPASTSNTRFEKFLNEDGSFEVIIKYVSSKTGRFAPKIKHVIYVGGTPYSTSVTFIKDFTETSGSFKFLHKDYLGTILAISTEAGTPVEKRHFDAWGNFTHLQKGTASVITNINTINATEMLIDRGYTSHEYLAGVELIHMNGRLYDPLLRRFLNADENIQDPNNTQNYNKYGYVMNNPLMYNDPSGEVLFMMFGIIMNATIHSIVVGAIYGMLISAGTYIVKSVVTGNWSWGGFAKSLLIGAVTGGATGGLLGMYSATGFNGAVVLGSMNGGISGGIQALFNGENFFTGLYRGAVMGGAMAGIGYTIQYLTSFVNMENKYSVLQNGQEVNGNNLPSDPNKVLKDLRDANYGTDYGNPKDYLEMGKRLNSDGTFYSDNGAHTLAVTKKMNFLTGRSSIAYSPAAFTNKYLLGDVMAHETAHAYGNYLLFSSWGGFRDKINSLDSRLDTVEHVVIRKLENDWVDFNNVPIEKLRNPHVYHVYMNGIIDVTKNFSYEQVKLYNMIYEKYKSIFIRPFIFK